MKKKLIAFFLTLAFLLGGCTVVAPLPETVPPVSEAQSGEGELTVWYVDVGQADCALLCSQGEYMLIDGGNVEDGSLVVSFLDQLGVEELKAVVCSHAHEDHVGGLASVLAVYPVDAVYAPTRTYSSRCFDDFMYYVNQQDLTVNIPAPGDSFSLGNTEVTVLGPVKSYPDTNNTSIVLRVDCGKVGFLFTGDMEQEAENDLMDSGANLSAQVLKAGHHGSSTSTGYRFLYEVDPTYTVISVGKGNSYGHPHEEVISRLNDQGAVVFRTDELGTVQAVCDGNDVTFTWDKQSADPQGAERAQEERYIGNRNSKIFHSPDCSHLPAEKNQVVFDTYGEAIEAGYTPHAGCLG